MRSSKVTVGRTTWSFGNSAANFGMNRWSSGTGGNPGASASRHFALETIVAPRKKRLPPVWSRWWWVLISWAIGLRVVFLIAVTSRFVMDGTISASTATDAEGPTI